MRILRAIQSATKVTAVFVLALTIASSLIIATPRATHAEGFLLDTVRCLVKTVLAAKCNPAEAPAQSQAPPPSTSRQAPAQSPAPATQAPTSSAQRSAPPAVSQFEPVAPIEVSAPSVVVPEVPRDNRTNDRIPESEYVRYFNAYSPYAVQGVQASGESAIVQTSTDGWKIAGVAWYWWGLLAAFIFALFFSVKYGVLRRRSVLSKGE